MKKVLAIAGFVLIIALAFLAGHECCRSGGLQGWQKDSTYTFVDTTLYKVAVDSIPPAEVIMKEVPAEVDTNAILADYFTEKSYDVRHRDSSLSINFKPVITENRLDSLTFDYRILRPQTIEHYSAAPANEIYGGLQGGELFLGPQIQWQFKNRFQAGVSYNLLDGPAKWQVSVSYRVFSF